jgi:hypothetical protein
MAYKKNRRRILIIDPSSQYKFIAIILIAGFIIVNIIGVAAFLPDILLLSDENLSMEIRSEAAKRMLGTHNRVWPVILGLLIIFSIVSMRVSHRLFGALYRFRWALDRIRKGDMSFRIKLRKGDYLHREKEGLNLMLDVFEEKLNIAREVAQGAAENFNEMEQELNKETSLKETYKLVLKNHRQKLEALVRHLAYFRLDEEKGKDSED